MADIQAPCVSVRHGTKRLPEPVIHIASALLLAAPLREHLSFVHFCDLRPSYGPAEIEAKREWKLTCSGPVASSTFLSSRTRINRGNRSEIPRSSTYIRDVVSSTTEQVKASAYQSHRCRIHGAQTQIRCKHLPHYLGLEPHVRLCAARLDVPASLGELERLEHGVMRREHLLAEPRADLADRLEYLAVGVVAGEQERAVDVRALALSVVAPDDS